MDEAWEHEVRPLLDLVDSLRQLGLNEARQVIAALIAAALHRSRAALRAAMS